MKKMILLSLTTLLLALVGLVSCGEDETMSGGNTGISNASWQPENWCLAAGQSPVFSFVAAGEWSAQSDQESWCSVTRLSDMSGASILKVTAAINTTGAARSATITVRVKGYPDPVRFKISQPAKDGDYQVVNRWMTTYMKSSYLWNQAIDNLTLDYSLDYKAFLTSILKGVAKQKDSQGRDLNYDDGHWKDGRRSYFYSNISGPALQSTSATRAGESITETGLWRLRANKFTPADGSGAVYGFAINGVIPGSSAAAAGLRRGLFITAVNGQVVTNENFSSLQMLLYEGVSVRVLPNTVLWNGAGAFEMLLPEPEVTISASNFINPAIYVAKMVTTGGKKVAYLLYMGFETTDDEKLIQTFAEFKKQGAEELILDLRYNGGGAVRSSTVLGTLIAGSAYKDQIYCKLTYNAQRTAKGESGVYRIGSGKVPDGVGNYEPIATALESALNLKRVFVLCSENTASSSELVINGLRGLGLEVNLIGTQTNGKNVGMEGYKDHVEQGASYTFMPITFYSENALGFKEYSEGFVPDVLFDDENYYPGDFATGNDPLFARATSWIRTGVKPAASALSRSQSAHRMEPSLVDCERPSLHSTGSLVFLDR